MDVLIIEDDPEQLASLVELLRNEFRDLEVSSAENLTSALACVAESPPRVIIRDLRDSEREVSEIVTGVREIRPSIGFVFVSAEPVDDDRLLAAGARIYYLQKPFTLDAFHRAMGTALSPGEFVGQVDGISLVDLLQVLHFGKRTVSVHVKRGAEIGWLHLAAGELVHASLGKCVGMEAFRKLMRWTDGEISTELGRLPAERTIDEPFSAVLLDTFRIFDERTGTAPHAEPAGDRAEGVGAPAPASSGRDMSPGEGPDVHEALRAIPGAMLVACVDLEGDPRLLQLAPADAVADTVRPVIPTAVAALFACEAFARLDSVLASPGDGSPGRSRTREIIALSRETIHFLLRSGSSQQRVSLVNAPTSANLGTVVARTRAWWREADRA